MSDQGTVTGAAAAAAAGEATLLIPAPKEHDSMTYAL